VAQRTNEKAPLYREVQRFRQVWLWVFVVSASLIAICGVVQQVIMGVPFGNNPAPDSMLIIIVIVVGFGFPLFFYLTNLTVEVRTGGLYLRFSPFHRSFREIEPEDIVRYAARTYSPIKEYGGWGIRHGWRSKAYNVSGNRGVQLEFSDGRQLLIGSQRPEELVEAMRPVFGERPE
jgi:hypothetical protein